MSHSIMCFLTVFLGLAFCDVTYAQEDLASLIERGDFYASKGQFALARADYESALAGGAGSALVLNRLGEIYMKTGEFERAVSTFRNSIREKPGQIMLYSKISEAFLAEGNLDSAIASVEQARKLKPQDSGVHSSLGFLLLQAGLLSDSRAHLDTALVLNPDNPDAHRFLGYYHTGLDSISKAVAHYQHLASIAPTDVEAQNNLAFLHAQQQQYGDAVEFYKRAMELAPDAVTRHAISRNLDAVRAIMDGKMRARYILVGSETEARDLLARLTLGGDFDALARQFSRAPNAAVGGDSGFFGSGELIEEFEKAVLDLQIGETSDVVQASAGFLVIQRLN